MSAASSSSPYRTGLATGLGVVLAAGLVLAIVDIAHAGGGFLPLLGLWALYALPIGVPLLGPRRRRRLDTPA